MTDLNLYHPQQAPLLRTKLFPPCGGGHSVLPRCALLKRLQDAQDRRLLILSAPAGFGKSTALSLFRQHLIAGGAQVAWLSCDEADSEPQRLLQYLVAAVETVLPGFGENTQRLLCKSVSWPAEALIDAFVADLERIAGHLYLILDDFHRIRHLALDRAARYLIEHLPPHVHLVSSTRHTPGLLLDEADSLLLRVEDIRFDLEETAAYFCEVRPLSLSDDEIRLLHVRTEGWVTALQLVGLALEHCSDRAAFLTELSGTERNMADYLTEDVLDRLPPALRQFLEQTSVLDEFCADLCDTLTDRQDSLDILKYLQCEQLFIIPLDERGEWFRYHHLFAEFLQGRLARRADPAPLLHAAVCWCESHDLPDRAIKYALRSRDFARAAELLERQGAQLIAGNRVYGILAMLKEIPAEVIREHPMFQIFYAWQLAFELRFAEAEALIEEVSTRLLQGRGKALHFGLGELLAASQVLKALILLYQDKLEACLKVSRQWLAMVPDNQPVFRASLANVQAAAYALLGEFGEAAKAITTARENLRQVDSEYLHVMSSLIEALICKDCAELERGRTIAETARARVERVFGRRSRVGGPLALAYADLLYEQDCQAQILTELPLATTWRDVATPVELISRGQLVMARTRFFAGEPEQALLQLKEWLAGLPATGYERVFAHGMACKVQFLLWLRRPYEAERIGLRLRQHLTTLPLERYADAYTALALTEARLALSERRPERAQASLEKFLSRQQSEYQRDRRLRLSLLLSVAYWRKGNNEKAFTLFKSTMKDAWGRGYRRLFQDDALWLLPLWEAWYQAEPARAGVWKDIAESMREQYRRLNVDPDTFDENQDVSHREQEILRYVAAGLSNRDIAQAVHLSEATIKWHLHNLFTKLSVRSRTQAVLKGKSLGLLSEA